MTPHVSPVLLDRFLAFGRQLRRAGLDVHPGRMLDLTEALQHIDLRARDEVYHACRSLFVHRHEDLATFDRVFDAFWRLDRGHHPAADSGTRAEPDLAGVQVLAAEEREDGGSTDDSGALKIWSRAARLATRSFAEFTDDEVAEAHAALARLTWTPGLRRTRRWFRGRGPRLDAGRALHQSLRTGGDIVVLPRRTRRNRARSIVMICDVSGSMERYSRMLLHFAHAISRRQRRLEAFLFSTRLTRITTELTMRGVDDAVTAVARAVPDWSSGTRIGEALRELHVRWARRVLHGGPVVLLVSDGWDCGDPIVLRDQVARLQRNAHRLIWLNPLIGTLDYAPLTRGLRAALPYVDDFLPARTLMNLADLARHLNALGPTPARARP